MARELNAFYKARQKFGIDQTEAARLYGAERALEFAGGKRPFTSDDLHAMETLAGQKARDKKAAQEAAKAEYRRTWGS